MTWKILEDQQPELAAFGAERLNGQVAYLATVRKDGAPRVHPMTPIIGRGHIFVFMEPTSPKGHDLQRDGRYAIHCAVSDNSGESGEFIVTGHAHRVENAELRALAVSLASYEVAERYILFEFDVDSAASTMYPDDRPVRRFWKKDGERCSISRQRKTSKVFICSQATIDRRSDRSSDTARWMAKTSEV